MNNTRPLLSIVLPCRNEVSAIDIFMKEVLSVITVHNINAEIIVSDSSSDGSYEELLTWPVRVIKHDMEGYGNAYLIAFKAIKGKYVVFCDLDCSYTFADIVPMLQLLKSTNSDLVSGKREIIQNGAMPLLHRFIGNPILSFLYRVLFNTSVSDLNSGLRIIRKSKLMKLKLRAQGMEFASEIMIEAAKNNFKIIETPISYKKRVGVSKLRTFSDGWRHLKLLFLKWIEY